MSRQSPQILTVRELFAEDRYVIPIYQRAYAWGQDEILTLLRDVSDYRRRGASSYYIGPLVTHSSIDPLSENRTFEVVDGQQRLTTLFILLATLRSSPEGLKGALQYAGRPHSSADLHLLAKRGKALEPLEMRVTAFSECVTTIRGANKGTKTDSFTDEDLQYLEDNVKLVRTELPAGTDLNHYFEVMNSRGEQLEKHEIVKAALMGTLAEAEGRTSHTLAMVWDSCSDMSRHMVATVEPSTRGLLFGQDWDTFTAASFVDVVDAFDMSATALPSGDTGLVAILANGAEGPTPNIPPAEETGLERYGAIIDFPNFLLHVLQLSVGHRDTVALDDKQLVVEFQRHITTPEQVEQFAFMLLKTRWLFDRYVIKTDLSRASDDNSNWVLQRVLKKGGEKKRRLEAIATFAQSDDDENSGHHNHAVMLQSMFQVTYSRRAYKTFLRDILGFLTQGPLLVDPANFITFLSALAADRLTALRPPGNLNRGTATPHFAFNYLDYLIWRNLLGEHHSTRLPAKGISYRGYRFRYRSSVEHFYPQHPDPSGNLTTLPPDEVDQFGNLCLMTRSENSQRSNLAPGAKIRQYRSDQQSLKFQLMASIAGKPGDWDRAQIKDHGSTMLALLSEGIARPSPIKEASTERGEL